MDVIIPTYKPDRSFTELLDRLEAQSIAPEHILIMNTEERELDPDLIRGHETVEVFHIKKSEFDHGATRNAGAGFSNADFFVFMTQDAMPADDRLIEELLRAFSRPRVKAAYARQIPQNDSDIIEGFTRSFNYPHLSHVQSASDLPERGIKTFFCSNVCAAYDRRTFEELNGFPEPCLFNEDLIYGGKLIRFGYEIAYASRAQVYHSHRYTKREQFRRYFDNGASQAMHPEIFRGVRSAGEGKALVKATRRYLKENRCGYLIPRLYSLSAAKLAGFFFGKRYARLPKKLVRAFSMNPDFFS